MPVGMRVLPWTLPASSVASSESGGRASNSTASGRSKSSFHRTTLTGITHGMPLRGSCTCVGPCSRTWRGHGRCLSTMELMASFAIARLELSAERAGAGASTLTESWCRTVASWSPRAGPSVSPHATCTIPIRLPSLVCHTTTMRVPTSPTLFPSRASAAAFPSFSPPPRSAASRAVWFATSCACAAANRRSSHCLRQLPTGASPSSTSLPVAPTTNEEIMLLRPSPAAPLWFLLFLCGGCSR
mmetsp:Transcript_36211/g.85107  ORF Transcript_36211/g.85107 Transcript_36211/m.85107 type:complete len:243 (-) Transcript_36211:366-1094(-)